MLADGEDASAAPRRAKKAEAAAESRSREVRSANGREARRRGAPCRAEHSQRAADPELPAGTEMVTMTVREALRDAMAEEMRRDEPSS